MKLNLNILQKKIYILSKTKQNDYSPVTKISQKGLNIENY